MPSIDIELEISRVGFCLWLVLSFLAIGAVLTLSLFWLCKIILLIGVGFYSYRLLVKDVLLMEGNSLRGISIERDKVVLHQQPDSFSAEILGDSLVTTFVSILRFKIKNKTHTHIVFYDATKAYRALTVALRYEVL